MKKAFLSYLIVMIAAATTFGSEKITIAHWEFNEGPAGSGVKQPFGARDSSGNGNHINPWTEGDWGGFIYTDDVPTPVIFNIDSANTTSVRNAGDHPTLMTNSMLSDPSGVDIEMWSPAVWTIEVSYKPEHNSDYRTMVGIDSQGNIADRPNLAGLYFQIQPDHSVRVAFADVSGYWHEATSDAELIQGFNPANDPEGISGTWYNIAAVSDGKLLSLYLDDVSAGMGYQLIAQTDLTESRSPDTALAVGQGSGSDWHGGGWSVGRGMWAGDHADRAYGFIDQVRISLGALDKTEFLMYHPVSAQISKAITESKPLIQNGRYAQALELLNLAADEYMDYKQSNPQGARQISIAAMHVFNTLAQTTEASNGPAEQIADYYQKSAFSHLSPLSITWLHRNLSSEEYAKFAGQLYENLPCSKGNISRSFAMSQNWPAFEAYLDIAFDRDENTIEAARLYEAGLSDNSSWLVNYLDYCRNRTDLIPYSLEKDIEIAERLESQGNFAQALEILKNARTDQDTEVTVRFAICDLLFKSGQYQQAISEIDSFVSSYRATNRHLTRTGILLKGQALIQLGDIDGALDEFLTFMIEYPEAAEAPAAGFFVGYCYMLQGKFDHAGQAMQAVINAYPDDAYANRARLSLMRIESMTD